MYESIYYNVYLIRNVIILLDPLISIYVSINFAIKILNLFYEQIFIIWITYTISREYAIVKIIRDII